jgi:hypothetical protein
MIVYKAVYTVHGDHVLKALVIEGKGVNDGFCQDNGL